MRTPSERITDEVTSWPGVEAGYGKRGEWGFSVGPREIGHLHGDKSQGQRERALASFESFKVDTLVATDVAARGIDVSGISHVINFDPPEDRDGYVHRIGRTGRAGRTGVGVTFVGAEQARDVERIAAELRLDREFAETALSSPARPGRSRNGNGNGGGVRQRSPRRR